MSFGNLTLQLYFGQILILGVQHATKPTIAETGKKLVEAKILKSKQDVKQDLLML